MNFVLDANIPYLSKELFLAYGSAIHVRDVGRQADPDDEVMRFAIEREAILVTKDLDFGNPYLFPAEKHFGLIIVRVPFYFSANSINAVLKRFLVTARLDELRRAVVIIEPGKVRIRKAE